MLKQVISLFIILVTISACSKKDISEPNERISDNFSKSVVSEQKKDKYMSYEHFITVDVREENIVQSYKDTIEACTKDTVNGCMILDSSISSGEYPAAHIRLRIKPEGVVKIKTGVSSKGKVIQESTHVEDLAKPIVDNENRLKMLESYRDRLLALQKKVTNDIDALIKLSSELSNVQLELEQAKGENVFLLQRVTMDIVNINFQVSLSRSFWKPISKSLSSFSHNLSDSISGTIVVFAYVLPGAILIIFIISAIRYSRRKIKK